VTLASFLKVQRYAFFEAATSALGTVREVPLPMRVSMVALAVFCVAMSLMVAAGLRAPYLIADAAGALSAGVFGSP
jgi:formate hydrogenlyase subunit 3/multisubunit Na+/H+ antiporter MnhD subunit